MQQFFMISSYDSLAYDGRLSMEMHLIQMNIPYKVLTLAITKVKSIGPSFNLLQ